MPTKSTYPLPKNEKQRLKELYDYHILDTIPEKEYDFITKMAAQICKVPASLITLLDKDRQWFKSNFGFEIKETPRAISFCNYSILDVDNILVVPDMRNDERFAENPLVTGEPHAVFYAGAPLITPGGFALGTICVLDGKANSLDEDQKEALKALANHIVTNFELHKKIYELTLTKEELKEANKNLKNFARIVSHDMKTPLANILMMAKSFQSYEGKTSDEHPMALLNIIDGSANELLSFIDRILARSETIGLLQNKPEAIDSKALLHKVIQFIAPPSDVKFIITGNFPQIEIDKTSLQQIFQNLITNAIKYNDKKEVVIGINGVSDAKYQHFIFTDNGSGIENNNLSKLFTGKIRSDKKDRYGNKGTGLGLVTLKEIIVKNGGKITATSELHEGSTFKVSLPKK